MFCYHMQYSFNYSCSAAILVVLNSVRLNKEQIKNLNLYPGFSY